MYHERIDWVSRTGLDIDVIDGVKDELQEGLARLNAQWGDDWMDWPLDNRDPEIVVKRGAYNFQRDVFIDGVRVGWVSRLGGDGDRPVEWHAYLRNPGEARGIALPNDSSKLRYAVSAVSQAVCHEAARAARYLCQMHGVPAKREEVAR